MSLPARLGQKMVGEAEEEQMKPIEEASFSGWLKWSGVAAIMAGAVALVSVLLLVAAPALSQPPGAELVQACGDAWEESSAYSSCGWPSITAEDIDNSECELDTRCQTDGEPPWEDPFHDTVIVASVDEIPNLHNCDGYLKLGNC